MKAPMSSLKWVVFGTQFCFSVKFDKHSLPVHDSNPRN